MQMSKFPVPVKKKKKLLQLNIGENVLPDIEDFPEKNEQILENR